MKHLATGFVAFSMVTIAVCTCILISPILLVYGIYRVGKEINEVL